MHLFQLVLAGWIAGATANDYGRPFDDSREQFDTSHPRGILEEIQPDLNGTDSSAAIADWFAIPRKSHKRRPWSPSDLSWLHNLESTTKSSRHTTSSSYTQNWILNLTQAVQQLTISVDNLSTVVRDLNNKAYFNSFAYNPRPFRDKRDVANKTSALHEPKNESTNTSTHDDGSTSNEKTTSATEIQNGRRSGHSLNSVKGKLLLYLDEAFDDIRNKVNSLRKIKERFANIAPYKIGYIVSNVDTLAVSIRNLREEAGRNRQLWEEREILDVYDRLKISNSLLTKLLETLRVLMENE